MNGQLRRSYRFIHKIFQHNLNLDSEWFHINWNRFALILWPVCVCVCRLSGMNAIRDTLEYEIGRYRTRYRRHYREKGPHWHYYLCRYKHEQYVRGAGYQKCEEPEVVVVDSTTQATRKLKTNLNRSAYKSFFVRWIVAYVRCRCYYKSGALPNSTFCTLFNFQPCNIFRGTLCVCLIPTDYGILIYLLFNDGPDANM